nr:LuxR C-terminal-related transcriptional regulator [Bacteroidota bacterium]
TYGVMCFHDVSVMVNSIRPNNYDVTFSPDKSHMYHEVYRRLRRILPKTNECTPREQEIVRCLDEGLSSKEIAHQLFISKATVDTHRQNMLRKWELPNTAALLRKSKEEGWI